MTLDVRFGTGRIKVKRITRGLEDTLSNHRSIERRSTPPPATLPFCGTFLLPTETVSVTNKRPI